jgi:hypothetical protein
MLLVLAIAAGVFRLAEELAVKVEADVELEEKNAGGCNC